ncbi:MAG: GtrA family protein [Bacteroidales bacterium]|nr:GtrA family protein [Bacteroidales bacterium]
MERTVILIKRLPKFIGVNIIGTVVDTAVLWVFSSYILKGYLGEYILSPIISFECAVLSNYLFSYFGVWKDRAQRHNIKAFAQKYIMYNISSSAVFVFKLGLLLLLEMTFGWDVVICNLVALCISGFANFALGEWVIFRKRRS